MNLMADRRARSGRSGRRRGSQKPGTIAGAVAAGRLTAERCASVGGVPAIAAKTAHARNPKRIGRLSRRHAPTIMRCTEGRSVIRGAILIMVDSLDEGTAASRRRYRI